MQDKAITAIGRIKGQKRAQPYQNYVQNMFPNKDNYKMLLAVFRLQQSTASVSCHFDHIDIETTSAKQDNYLKFAYRKGAANGGDVTFTTKMGDVAKKFKTFYPKQVKDVVKLSKLLENQADYAIFQALQKELESKQELIKQKLIETAETVDKETAMSMGFSVKFLGEEGPIYLEKFATLQEKILLHGTAGKSNKYSVKSEGKDNCCSICMKTKPLLHGFASPYKYSTVDKAAFVSGFFNQRTNWKNYPICEDCALEFEMGKDYIDRHLRKYFYGKNYFLIPQTVGGDEKQLALALKSFEKLDYQAYEGIKIHTKEDFLMRRIGEGSANTDQLQLNLLFYEENPTTKAIKIKLLLEEILPSRFQTLFVKATAVVDQLQIAKNGGRVNKDEQDLHFSFAFFRSFFDKEFYAILQAVFMGTALSKELLYKNFMDKIRKEYRERSFNDLMRFKHYHTYSYDKANKTSKSASLVVMAMQVWNYLSELNIIQTNKNEQEMDEITTDKEVSKKAFDMDKFHAFLQENEGFFDDDYKRGIFSVGVLVRLLFNIQNASLGNTPFEKKLKGYNLNPELLKRVYMEALEKISAYQKSFFAYGNLRDYISEHFNLNAHKLNSISNNELSFYFVSGLEMGNRFKSEKE